MKMPIYTNSSGEVSRDAKQVLVVPEIGNRTFFYARVEGTKVILTSAEDSDYPPVDSDMTFDDYRAEMSFLFQAALAKAKELSALIQAKQPIGAHKAGCRCPVCKAKRGERPVMRKQLLVKLPRNLIQLLRAQASVYGLSVTEIVERAIIRELKEYAYSKAPKPSTSNAPAPSPKKARRSAKKR
jgi:hypothetical protein